MSGLLGASRFNKSLVAWLSFDVSYESLNEACSRVGGGPWACCAEAAAAPCIRRCFGDDCISGACYCCVLLPL